MPARFAERRRARRRLDHRAGRRRHAAAAAARRWRRFLARVGGGDFGGAPLRRVLEHRRSGLCPAGAGGRLHRPHAAARPRAGHGRSATGLAHFRSAVPDLKVAVTDLVAAGDRVTVRLHFTGHFTGQFGKVRGKGQAIDFQAIDLCRVVKGRIADNWRLEGKLTLLQQTGVVQQ
ncbi:ester cyclase [Rugamonas violacea]|nr:ester cyclase [Rugamonas sp. CCM 8940]